MIGWRGTSDGCVHGGCCIAPRRAGCFGSSVSSFNSCRGAGGRKRDPKTFQTSTLQRAPSTCDFFYINVDMKLD
ncbi:unnamed protein product [Urochloa humidicola]